MSTSLFLVLFVVMVRRYAVSGPPVRSTSVTERWANFGLDLHLDRDRSRVRAGLERALREAIQSGRLPSATRLPSSRSLAGDLGIARNTVVEAYTQLVAEGWLSAQQGSCTVVASRPPERRPATVSATAPRVAVPRYDLRPGSPDLAAFPRSAWLASARRAITAAPNEAFGYGDPRGRIELREALAGYLARVRGVRTGPDRIIVCSGFTQGLGLIGSVLAAGGSRSWLSEPYGLPVQTQIAASGGYRIHALPMDVEGAVVDPESADRGSLGPRPLLLLSPAHQFPLGFDLSAARRRAAVKWSELTAGVVVEDDYDGEFRYDRRPVGALQALAPDRVVYAGTASKSLAPGLRLGWLAAEPPLLDELVSAKESADRQSTSTEQLTLADFFVSGRYDHQVRRMRLVYRRRRDRLVGMLGRSHPGSAGERDSGRSAGRAGPAAGGHRRGGRRVRRTTRSGRRSPGHLCPDADR